MGAGCHQAPSDSRAGLVLVGAAVGDVAGFTAVEAQLVVSAALLLGFG